MNPADELRILIGDGGITEDAVQSITGITTEKLQSFLNRAQSGMVVAEPKEMEVLSSDESMRLSSRPVQRPAFRQPALPSVDIWPQSAYRSKWLYPIGH